VEDDDGHRFRLSYQAMNEANDTTPEVRRAMYRLAAAMSPRERFQQLCELNAFGRRVMRAGILEQYPGASEAEIQARLAERLHGTEFARKYFGLR
jgi:hypothetical protein